MKIYLIFLYFCVITTYANPFAEERLQNLPIQSQYSWEEFKWVGKLNHGSNQVVLSGPMGELILLQQNEVIGWEKAQVLTIENNRIVLQLPASNKTEEILY